MKKACMFLAAMLCAMAYCKGQNQIVDNGYNKFYYPDGSISSEGILRNGQPDGFWKTYYPNGKLKSAGKRTDFQLDSTWIFFDERGDTTSLINYNYGKKNGYSCTYETYADSVKHNVLKSRELYRDDKRQGYAFYYKKGILDSEIPYKDDRKHGEGYQYDQNGTIVAILTYKYNDLVDRMIINRTDENGLKQGFFRTFYPDKKMKTECYYKDGKLNGYFREFDQKGKEISAVRYVNGEIQLEQKNSLASDAAAAKVKIEYNDNGTMKKSGAYKDNKPVGVHRTYNKDGKINGGALYDDNGIKIADGITDGRGREQGKWTVYDSTGAVRAKGQYKNGKREGQWYFYFADGKTEQEGVYKDGKPDGKWMWYFADGKIRREEHFAKGKEDGIYYELSHQGDTLQCGEYIEGEKHGTWRMQTGDALVVENYNDGIPHGEYTVYNLPDMSIRIRSKYLNGNLHGQFTEYYDDGKVYREGQYMGGNQNGPWKIYNEEGLLLTIVEYRQGEIVKVDGNEMPKK